MQQQIQRAALLEAVREALCEAPVVALLGASFNGVRCAVLGDFDFGERRDR